jgi:hypothetical protein
MNKKAPVSYKHIIFPHRYQFEYIKSGDTIALALFLTYPNGRAGGGGVGPGYIFEKLPEHPILHSIKYISLS